MQAVIVVLYTAAALLPLSGLLGLYFSAQEALRRLQDGAGGPNASSRAWLVNDFFDIAREEMLHRPSRVIRDFALIGGGVLCGSVAGIWALFPVS